MENDKEETVDRLNGDAVDEVKNVPIVDADNTNDAEESTAETSEKTKTEVEVCIIFCFREKIMLFTSLVLKNRILIGARKSVCKKKRPKK